MKYQKITMIFSLVVVVGSLIYDGVIIAMGGTEASISHMVIEYSKEFPLIPLLCGILCGHFFWGIKMTKQHLEKLPFEQYSKIRMWIKEIEEERADKQQNFK